MADPMVQATQEWLNSTYGDYAWFEMIPPERIGKTSWATMFALTRALQFELGISASAIADSFGPATTTRFAEQVGVVAPNSPTRIIKLLQGALYCKGYDGSGLSAVYDSRTIAGVTNMMADMGLAAPYSVDAKVMQAALTMDPYVLIVGGSTDVRTVQRWMNDRYRSASWYTFIPCDGYFSRTVQKMLVFAIQVRLNVTGANGNYGPGTRTAMRSSAALVQVGSTGLTVQLFKAALIFNRYQTVFGDTYDSATKAVVEAMQRFERMAVTGAGDYATWSALLVSNGDPDRPVTGLDTRFWINSAMGNDLHAAGYRAVGRYLTNVPGGLNKKLQPGELTAILGAGLAVWPIYQAGGGAIGYFTPAQGADDAANAVVAAQNQGIPIGTVLYFAVDFDATDELITSNIIPYFDAVVTRVNQLGRPYLIGVYGSRNVSTRVSNESGAVSSFVSGMSSGFSGNLGFPLPQNWAFNQIKENYLDQELANGKSYTQVTNSGQQERIAIDRNAVSGHDPGVRTLTSSGLTERLCDLVDIVETYAINYRAANPGALSINELVLQYFRQPTYDTTNWTLLAGAIDAGFIAYCDARISSRVEYYVDDVHHIILEAAHFMATANAVAVHRLPTNPVVCNLGDIGGWGGDLLSTYKDFNTYGQGADALAFARDWIGAKGLFTFSDLLEDLDGLRVGDNAGITGEGIGGLVRGYLTHRISSDPFAYAYTERFAGSDQVMRTAVIDLFTTNRIDIAAARAGIAGFSAAIGTSHADAFAQAFVEVFNSHL